MLYEIQNELAEELAAQGVPYEVFYGPERNAQGQYTVSTPRIVIQEDDDRGDTFDEPTKAQQNPMTRGVVWIGAVCRIYMQSTEEGAAIQDHRRLARKVLRHVFVALDKVIRKRKNRWRRTAGKFLSVTDLQVRGLEVWPGVVYELPFSFDQAINATNWDGAAKAEKALGTDVAVKSTTKANLATVPDTTETACGA